MSVAKQVIGFMAILALTAAVGFRATSSLGAHKSRSIDASHVVNLLSDHADPSVIAVVKGEYVQFNSKDGKTHNIGQGSGDDEVHQSLGADQHDHAAEGKESGEFSPSEGYRVQFNQTGTYAFHDHLNPKISITVVVYEKK